MLSKAGITLLTAGVMLLMLGLLKFIPAPLTEFRGGSDPVPGSAYVQLLVGLAFFTLGVVAGRLAKRRPSEKPPESTSDRGAG